MTIYTNHNGKDIFRLNGNMLSGDTYGYKGYIKDNLGGKWDADKRAWRVDLDKVAKDVERGEMVGTDSLLKAMLYERK